jgi:hypothetical protein
MKRKEMFLVGLGAILFWLVLIAFYRWSGTWTWLQ